MPSIRRLKQAKKSHLLLKKRLVTDLAASFKNVIVLIAGCDLSQPTAKIQITYLTVNRFTLILSLSAGP